MHVRESSGPMLVAARPVYVAVLEFLVGRLAHFDNSYVEVEVHPGERVVPVGIHHVAFDGDHRDDLGAAGPCAWNCVPDPISAPSGSSERETSWTISSYRFP